MNKKNLKVIVPIAATVVMLLGCAIPGVGKNKTDEDLLNTIQAQTVDAGKTQIEMPEIEVPEIPEIEIPEIEIPEIEKPEVNVPEKPEVNIDLPVAIDNEDTLEKWLLFETNNTNLCDQMGITEMKKEYEGTYDDIYFVAADNVLVVVFRFTAEGFDQSMADAGVAAQLQDYMDTNVTKESCLRDIVTIYNVSGLYPDIYGFEYQDINGNTLASIYYTIDEIMSVVQQP